MSLESQNSYLFIFFFLLNFDSYLHLWELWACPGIIPPPPKKIQKIKISAKKSYFSVMGRIQMDFVKFEV